MHYAAGAYGADCVCNRCLDGCPEGAGYSFVLAGLFFCFLASFLLGCWLIYEGLKGALAQRPALFLTLQSVRETSLVLEHPHAWAVLGLGWRLTLQTFDHSVVLLLQDPYLRRTCGGTYPTSCTRCTRSWSLRSASTVRPAHFVRSILGSSSDRANPCCSQCISH